MKKIIEVLLVLVMLESVVSPVSAINIDAISLNKKLESLERVLKNKKLSGDQIERIKNTITTLSKRLPERQIDDIIKSYKEGVFVYSTLTPEEREKLRKLAMKYPMTPSGYMMEKSRESTDTEILGFYDVQKDGRMYTNDYDYAGIKGKVYPNTLEVSRSGTHRHLLTSHVGETVNGQDQWIELGVYRDANEPNKYFVFSWDSDNSDQPGNKKWEDHFQIDPYRWHDFEILVLPYNYTHSEYVMWFDGQRVRSGFIVVDTTCQVDMVHEAWAEDIDAFESSSHSYFKQASLYEAPNYNKIPWGDNVATTHYALYPMRESHTLEYYNSNHYWKFETWLESAW